MEEAPESNIPLTNELFIGLDESGKYVALPVRTNRGVVPIERSYFKERESKMMKNRFSLLKDHWTHIVQLKFEVERANLVSQYKEAHHDRLRVERYSTHVEA